MKYVRFMFYKFYKCIKICHNWGYLSFGHSGAAILGPQGQTREKGFCIPFIPHYMEYQATPGCLLPLLLITVGRVRTLLLYCKAPELLVFAPSLWRDAACPRARASSIPQGEVCTSLHYIPQGRNSEML